MNLENNIWNKKTYMLQILSNKDIMNNFVTIILKTDKVLEKYNLKLTQKLEKSE